MTGQVGSGFYIAPEVQRGQAYTAKCDVWSLGVTFYVMLTGSAPAEGVAKGELSSSCGLSCRAKDMIKRMLTADPTSRPTLGEILEHGWFEL
jgi:calcium-dependent protein kinase